MQALVLLPEWSCGACTAAMKISRGCDGPAEQPITLDGEVMTRCPRRPLLDHPYYFEELFWLYGNYREGVLPQRGGLDDQPAKLLAAFRVLKSTQEAAQDEKDLADRKAAARANR